MQNDNLSEKLYTSTEVAEILGVSLRSIYRYLDENKIQAAVRTATGRHRFTRQNINDFLHPGSSRGVEVSKPTEGVSVGHTKDEKEVITKRIQDTSERKQAETERPESLPEESRIEEEPIDWLSRFRQAAEKYKTQETEAPASVKESAGDFHTGVLHDTEEVTNDKKPEVETEELESEYMYYRSGVGGLKEIAQSLDKAAKNASLDYAFTMNAGLSLHKPIKPFSLIHAYIRKGDLGYFEKVLQLTPCQKDAAQLCLIPSNDEKLYGQRREMHGLYVVSDSQIKLDLLNEGEVDLANELE